MNDAHRMKLIGPKSTDLTEIPKELVLTTKLVWLAACLFMTRRCRSLMETAHPEGLRNTIPDVVKDSGKILVPHYRVNRRINTWVITRQRREMVLV